MVTYVAPQLIEYGSSKNLIKGSCGWSWSDAFNEENAIRWNLLECADDGRCILVGSVCSVDKPIMECDVADGSVHPNCR